MKRKYFIYLLIGFAVFFALCNPLQLYFLSDDFDSMYAARLWSGVLHSYRPGSDFLLHTDRIFYGFDARGYHITNYVLHFATCIMLFFTAKVLLKPFYEEKTVGGYAFTASIIFLFYPFHSEPVFWLVGRSALLAVLFAMASIYFWIRKKTVKIFYFVSLFCLLLGLFSYESIWLLPVIIIIISFLYDKDISAQKKLWQIAGYWLTFFSYLAARFYLTSTVIGSPYGTNVVVSYNPFLLVRNFCSLISRSFIPPMQSSALFVFFTIILVPVSVGIFYKLKKEISIPLLVSCISFFVCLLPVISLGIDTHDTESERFLYMPSAFLSIVFAIILFYFFKQKTAYILTAFLVVQIVFLEMSYQSFKAASKVTKASVEAIESLQNTDTIYCINLPEQYKGGFIFRNGFASAVKLFAPQIKNVIINPHKELFTNPEVYNFKTFPIGFLPPQNNTNRFIKASGKTAVFIWTDSSLIVYK